MSLTVSDVWEADVWKSTVWASGVWAEEADEGAPGKRKWTYRPDLAEEEEEEKPKLKRKILRIIKPDRKVQKEEKYEKTDQDITKLIAYLEAEEQENLRKKKRTQQLRERDIVFVAEQIMRM